LLDFGFDRLRIVVLSMGKRSGEDEDENKYGSKNPGESLTD
jgi:hypothetical protein